MLAMVSRVGPLAADAVDAVQAVVDAEVGEQDLQQADAAAVGRIAVADAHAFGAADATPAQRVPLVGAPGGAGSVVLGGVGQDSDTASGYGLSEKRIGRHLSWRRRDFLLSTPATMHP
jgi:hypothetical protein